MSHTFRLPAVICAALLGLTGIVSTSYAQSAPESGPAAARAATLTRYYTQHLQLLPHQYRPAYRAALLEVQSLDSLQALGVTSATALAGVEARFARHLNPVLSAAQRSSLAGLHAPSLMAPAAPVVAGRH